MRGEAEPRLAEGFRENGHKQGLRARLRQARDRGHRDGLREKQTKIWTDSGMAMGGQGLGQAGTLPQARGTVSKTGTIRVTSPTRGNQDKAG